TAEPSASTFESGWVTYIADGTAMARPATRMTAPRQPEPTATATNRERVIPRVASAVRIKPPAAYTSTYPNPNSGPKPADTGSGCPPRTTSHTPTHASTAMRHWQRGTARKTDSRL